MNGNVNVGIDRIHSRVLKPPGGGYSELFFTEPAPIEAPRPVAKRSENRIICDETETTPNVELATPAVEEVTSPAKRTNNRIICEETNDDVQPEKEAAARKSRVPPGGFSSGLW